MIKPITLQGFPKDTEGCLYIKSDVTDWYPFKPDILELYTNDKKIILDYLVKNYNDGIYLEPVCSLANGLIGGSLVSESYCLSEINKLRKQVKG